MSALTALRSYPYPQSTDDVRPYEDIQSLADAVDADVDALYAAAWVAWSSPSLTWTASSVNPALGNGSLIGRYQLLTAKMVRFQGKLTLGSTSTLGTGFWIFNPPFNASVDAIALCIGTHRMDDISAQSRPGTCRFNAASQLILDNSIGVVTASSPVAGVTGDSYVWDMIYDRV